MRPAVLVVLLFLLPAEGASAGNSLFQGQGGGSCVWGFACCEETIEVLVTVESVGDRTFGTLHSDDRCFLFYSAIGMFLQGTTVFHLKGDWDRGFSGCTYPVCLAQSSVLTIGPYGDGTNIPFEVHLWTLSDKTWTYLVGNFRDLRMDEAVAP